jgi:hypothetical protein
MSEDIKPDVQEPTFSYIPTEEKRMENWGGYSEQEPVEKQLSSALHRLEIAEELEIADLEDAFRLMAQRGMQKEIVHGIRKDNHKPDTEVLDISTFRVAEVVAKNQGTESPKPVAEKYKNEYQRALMGVAGEMNSRDFNQDAVERIVTEGPKLID